MTNKFIHRFPVSVKIGDTFKTSSKFYETTQEIVTIEKVVITLPDVLEIEGTSKTIESIKKADQEGVK